MAIHESLDDHTREAVAAYILYRRLQIPEDKISIQYIQHQGNYYVGILALRGREAMPIMIGPLLTSFDLLKGRWQEACQSIELKLWSEDKAQSILEGSRVASGRHEIIKALHKRNMLPAGMELNEKMYRPGLVDVFGADICKDGLVSFELKPKAKPE